MPKLRSQVKNAVTKAVGSEFWITKTVVATSVLTTATDLTTAATGKLHVEDIQIDTDGTGLNSTANAFTITQTGGGAFGALTLVSQVTSGLGANVSMNFYGGVKPTTGVTSTLDGGTKLQFKVATSAATGAGNIRISVLFRRIDENAQCNAA